jgi:protein-L-isoaspartate O-methyltransferase
VSGSPRRLLAHAAAWLALALALAAPSLPAQPAKDAASVAPYVPTPWVIVDEIMALAAPGPGDVVIDLGSGDGRLVITAVLRRGASRGLGVDIDASLVRLASENAAKAGVADRVRFETRDLFATSVADATVVTLYLLPTAVPKVETKLLAEMKPGARVVSHDYPFPEWKPERVVSMEVADKVPISGTTHTALYLYVVPARIAGTWDVSLEGLPAVTVSFSQDARGATGTARAQERALPLPDVKVAGERVEFTLPAGIAGTAPLVLRGAVRGEAIQGTTSSGQAWRASRRT